MSELAAAHLRTARSVVFQLGIDPTSAEFDDLVQEGAVAAWLATAETPRRDPVTYGMVVARRRVQRILAGRQAMVGSENRGSKTYETMRRRDRRGEMPSEAAGPRWEPFSAADDRLDMERATHGLDERDRAILDGVARGEPWATVAELAGMSLNGVRNRWRYVLAPRMRVRLAA